jgi:membrane protease YdiL (CAAX protease family)
LKMSKNGRGIAAYLSIAFAGAWSLWLAAWIVASRVFHISASNPLFNGAVLPGAFMPAIGAIIVRRWITHEGFSDAGLRLNFRKSWKHYLFAAYLLPLGVVGIIVALAVLLRISQPDFSLHRSLAALSPQLNLSSFRISQKLLLPILIIQMIVEGVPIATLITWGEEFGWRGYLQLRLFSGKPTPAAIVTGLIWGIWHYPLIVLGYERYESIPIGLLVFPVSTIMLSIIFGWLRSETGSVWSSSVAHGATNALGGSLALLLFLGGPHFVFVNYLGILSWLPLGAVCGWILSRHVRVLPGGMEKSSLLPANTPTA